MTVQIDSEALDELGATLDAALAEIGRRLGLYDAMAGAGPLTPRELAARTRTSERYLREWLNAQAAGGSVTYEGGRYELPPEQVAADAFSPRASLREPLLRSWLPALDGVEAKLRAGARVADIGSTAALLAEAFPASVVSGFGLHAAADFPGTGYDLVTTVDSLHVLGDPLAAAQHIRSALAPDGSWLIVEPFAGDRVEDNLNPVGRFYYAVSALISLPASLMHDDPIALGAQAGERCLHDVAIAAGFTRFRRVAATPLHLVLEARP
jgi:hypothetical protein